MDTNSNDVDLNHSPTTSSAKIQTASKLAAIKVQEKRQAAIGESSEFDISSPLRADLPFYYAEI
jgi:hypothetical protein